MQYQLFFETVIEINPEVYSGEIVCPNCGGSNTKSESRSGCFFEIMRLLDETAEHNPEAMPAVILAENVSLTQEVYEAANAKGIAIYSAKESVYELCAIISRCAEENE